MIEIVHSVISDKMKLNWINYRSVSGKSANVCQSSNTWVNQEIKREIRKCFIE